MSFDAQIDPLGRFEPQSGSHLTAFFISDKQRGPDGALPVVPENHLDGDQPSHQQGFVPPDSGGGGAPVAGPKNPIGPVQGYPEDGKHAWRAANDDVIVETVRKYNYNNNLFREIRNT